MKQKNKKQIKRIPIKLPDNSYQPKVEELSEEVHIAIYMS